MSNSNYSSLYKEINSLLKEARIYQNLRITELHKASGVATSTIHLIEKKDSDYAATWSVLEKLCSALNVNLSKLLLFAVEKNLQLAQDGEKSDEFNVIKQISEEADNDKLSASFPMLQNFHSISAHQYFTQLLNRIDYKMLTTAQYHNLNRDLLSILLDQENTINDDIHKNNN